jgi:Holliday junction resolvase RusA-like endonuclease
LTEQPVVFHCRVIGEPKPQGSTRAFIPKGWNRAIVTATNKKQGQWRDTMSFAFAARNEALQGTETPAVLFPKGPVSVAAVFIMPRPKSAKKGAMPTVAPDLDKLLRCANDSLQESCIVKNDSQIVSFDGSCKRYQEDGEPIGVIVTVTEVRRDGR